MRRLLVENARRKACLKHGGGHVRVELDNDVPNMELGSDSRQYDLLAVNEAL